MVTLGCPDYTADANDSPNPTYRDAVTSLTRLSLANRLIVALISIAIVVFGVLATRSLKQELLPSTQVPTAVVTAIYPGATPQIVADNVSTPIERAVSGVAGSHRRHLHLVQRPGDDQRQLGVRAGQRQGRQQHPQRRRLHASQALPADVETDVITGSTDDIPVLLLAASTDLPLAASGELVQNVAVPALTAIEGVRQVQVTGEDTTQLTITLRPDDLTERDLTAAAVTQTVQSQLRWSRPAPRTTRPSSSPSRWVTPPTRSSRSRPSSIPTSDGPVALSKIADVKVESISSSSLARANGRPRSACRCSRRPTVTRWPSRTPSRTHSPVCRRRWATTPRSPSCSTRPR